MDSGVPAKKNTIVKNIVKYLIFLIIAFIFTYVSSLWTSPAYKNWYGCDCSFFTMVGRGITQGLVPYKDFFDLKGPYFFFIEALGQFIHKDRLGAFIIQVIFASFSFSLVWEMARLYLGRAKSIAVVVIFTIGQISMLWGGNTLEEYMLPVNLVVVYLTMRFLKDKSLKTDNIPPYLPIVSGLCFGIIMFAKVTVGAPIMGLCLAIGLSLLAYKKIKGFFMYCLYFLLGLLIAAVPVLIYFAYHRCLLYMFYCVFDFAFKRGTDFSEPFTLEWEIKMIGCYIGFVMGILHFPRAKKEEKKSVTLEVAGVPNNSLSIDSYADSSNSVKERKKKPTWLANLTILSAAAFDVNHESIHNTIDKITKHINKNNKYQLKPEYSIMLICMSLISIFLLHFGNPFIYYFITTMPTLLLALILLLDMYKPLILFYNVRQAVCLIMVGIFMFYYGGQSLDTWLTFKNERDTNTYNQEYYDDCKEMANLIPQWERDQVFSFDIDMNWFEINQIMPCYKYQINLQFFIALDPRIEDEILVRFKEMPPKWMVISHTLQDYLPTMYVMMTEKYDCIYTNDVGCLYLLK